MTPGIRFPKLPILVVATALLGAGAARCTEMRDEHDGWQKWTPRDEISPMFRRDVSVDAKSSGTLVIETGDNPAAYGAWQQTITNLGFGKTYRFQAKFRTDRVENARRSIIPRLQWLDAEGRSARSPDFTFGRPTEDGWFEINYSTRAPKNATQVNIQLGLGFAPGGTVWWKEVRLTEEPNPPSRTVRVATIHHRPGGTKTAAESVAEFAALVEKAAVKNPDIICLPEGITAVGNPLSYIEVSEPVPGPTTRILGELARAQRCYLVAGIYERVGKIVYNTAVLLDRDGNLAGTYRKTHLPREEWEAGLMAGDEYPVFDTDFGRIGLMICWDVQFPEPARAMALKGAELLLLPIWGGNEILTRARAIENHVFLVSSSYDMRSFIIDPTGTVLDEATTDDAIAVSEVQLDGQIFQPWLGDMKERTWKERRPDIAVE